MTAILVLALIFITFVCVAKKYSSSNRNYEKACQKVAIQSRQEENKVHVKNEKTIEKLKERITDGESGDELHAEAADAVYQMAISDAKGLRTDLLEMTAHNETCGECAKYQGRVYSISGRDKRFPKLPEFLKKYGRVHDNCRHTFYPFCADIVSDEKLAEVISYSNRPFEDNRGEIEKVQYEEKRMAAVQIEQDRVDYKFIQANFPDIAPKSFGGYRKMKKAMSKNYISIIEKAKEYGYKIE